MNQIIKYLVAYAIWIADLILAFWLIFISRNAFLGILALFYHGSVAYLNAVNFADKAFMIVLGLSWLAFSIFSEQFFRVGVQENVLLKRIARVTGPIFLGIFSVDLILFWLQGVGAGNWLRWLILAFELGIGIALLVSVKPQSKSQPT
jgi:hypothetical protein